MTIIAERKWHCKRSLRRVECLQNLKTSRVTWRTLSFSEQTVINYLLFICPITIQGPTAVTVHFGQRIGYRSDRNGYQLLAFDTSQNHARSRVGNNVLVVTIKQRLQRKNRDLGD